RYHNDAQSTGVNPNEVYLSPSSVSPTTFGRAITVGMDGPVVAQPLYVPNVLISTGWAAGTRHDVVYAATEGDSVYAIDAATGVVLWRTSFVNPDAGITPLDAFDDYQGTGLIIEQTIGITATPVIDAASQTLYVLAMTREVRADA